MNDRIAPKPNHLLFDNDKWCPKCECRIPDKYLDCPTCLGAPVTGLKPERAKGVPRAKRKEPEKPPAFPFDGTVKLD